MGAHAVTNDTAGGEGGAEEGGNKLAVWRRSVVAALQLPRREAPDVNVKPVQVGPHAGACELNL
jgi:hypothetical protein